MVKVVGFDLDNTLFDQAEYEFPIFEKIARLTEKQYGMDAKQYFSAMSTLYRRGEKSDFFGKALLEISEHPSDWENFVVSSVLPAYREYSADTLSLSPLGATLLDLVQHKDVKTVLITNGRVATQESKIKALGLENFFDLVLISDQYSPAERKPSLYMFEVSLKHFDIDPEEMIFIGDDDLRDGASQKIGIPYFSVYAHTILEDIEKALDA